MNGYSKLIHLLALGGIVVEIMVGFERIGRVLDSIPSSRAPPPRARHDRGYVIPLRGIFLRQRKTWEGRAEGARFPATSHDPAGPEGSAG